MISVVIDEGRLFLSLSNTADDEQIFKDIGKKCNWNIHLRNEAKSFTTPVMQMGMYELIKIQ